MSNPAKCPGCLLLREQKYTGGRFHWRCLNTFCPYYKELKQV